MMPSTSIRIAFSALYDRLYSERNRARLEHWIMNLSILGFLVHLALIFLSRTLPHPPALIAIAGKNYLSAIYTPFSFILFFEVLMLIAALPQSTTQSIAKQYEIVSLIFIRQFFKDIAELDDIGKLAQFTSDVLPVFVDLSAGLFMFLLVTVFLHAARRRTGADSPPQDPAALKTFISRKKSIAVALSVLLVSLAAHSLWQFAREILEQTHADPNSFFYGDVFTAMIFTDVLIVILSLAVSDRYELVFRNGAFVISTILIRFSLTVGHPFADELAVAGMIFGILTLLIYNYHAQIRQPGPPHLKLT
jgi:hypothetical protein